VLIVLKSGSLNLLEPLGTVQAYNGIALTFLHIKTFATIYDPKGSCPVNLSILNKRVCTHHIQVECATMCYIREYISQYILGEVYDLSHVRGYSVLNKCKKMHSMNSMKLTVTKHSFCQRKQPELHRGLTEMISVQVHLRDFAY